MGQRSVLEALMGGGAIWRSRDLVDAGVATATVKRALADGRLERISRGTYRLKGSGLTGGEELAGVLARTPAGIVCMYSAAAMHGLGDGVPGSLWIALPHDRRPPQVPGSDVRWVRWRRHEAFTIGIIQTVICGVTVRSTGPARTVVDMLYSGLGSGLDLLRDYLAAGGTGAELREVAYGLGRGRRISRTISLAEALAGNG